MLFFLAVLAILPGPSGGLLAPVERWNPYATLTAVTALWGSQHSVIKLAETAGASSDVATAARFCVAAACLSPWLPKDSSTWRAGIELGTYSFCGFAAQAVGLETTTATKSAFLLYLNVKLVPVVGLLAGRTPDPKVWFWAGIALAGTTALAADEGFDRLVVGDAWCVAAAAASAVFIFRLEDLSKSVDGSAAQLTSATASTTAALALSWTALGDNSLILEDFGGVELFSTTTTTAAAATLASALYLGAVPSALCGYLQTVAQKQVSAYRAAVIYALDPLWAAAFAHVILHEDVGGPTGQIGAFLVAFAALAQPLQDLVTPLSPSSERNDDRQRGDVVVERESDASCVESAGDGANETSRPTPSARR